MNGSSDSTIQYGFVQSAEDERDTLEFYRRMFPKSNRVLELMEWRRSAPAGSGAAKLFIARLGGIIVGAMNIVAVDLQVGSKTVRGVWQQDSVVSPETRGRGVGRQLIDQSGQGYDVLLAKGISDAMYKLRKASGFIDVRDWNYMVRVLSPFRYGTTVKQSAYGVALAGLSFLKRRHLPKLVAAPINEFGADFDRLASSPIASTEIRPIKNDAYLRWRYGTCPGRSYVCLASASPNLGAAVVRLGSASWIVDVVCGSGDAATLSGLIGASVERCRAAGAASVHAYVTSAGARDCLSQHGFVHVPSPPRFMYRLGSNADPSVWQSIAGWNFWHGDGDIELYR
jgi:GNAT superfamily N-acetyltransferase